jgi:hypothetical protein
VELNELDRLTENGPVYERQGEAQQQRKEWENSALLSTYLGHVKLAGTFVYLHTTPQLLNDIANRCEDYFKGATS